MPAYPGSEPDEPQIEVSAAPGQAVDILRVTSAGRGVTWRFSYSVASINGTFAESLTTAGIEVDATDGVSGKHQVHGFTAIDMTAHRESCILIWKLERVGGDDADTYSADARLLELDFHFQAEKAGTFTEIPV